MNKLKILGPLLKKMRVDAELSQSQMAAFCGVKSRKTIENWESGATVLNIKQFIMFMDACGKDADKVIKFYMNKILSKTQG